MIILYSKNRKQGERYAGTFPDRRALMEYFKERGFYDCQIFDEGDGEWTIKTGDVRRRFVEVGTK